MRAGDVHEHGAERFLHALGMAVAVAGHVQAMPSLGVWLVIDIDEFLSRPCERVRRPGD